MLLTMDNLKKAKEGDLFEFYFNNITDSSLDAIRDDVSSRIICMQVVYKTEDEILLDELDALFDYKGDNMHCWEKTDLCKLLNKLSKFLPVEAECSILSKEEIQKFTCSDDRAKSDKYGDDAIYWTKTEAKENRYYFVNEEGEIVVLPPDTNAGVSISIRVKLPKENVSMLSFEDTVKKLEKELDSVKVSDYVAACFEQNEITNLAKIHPHFNALCWEMTYGNKATAAIKFAQIYDEICKIEEKFELTEIGNMPVSKWIAENLERIETQIYINENDRDDERKKKLDWNQIGEEMASVIASVRTTNKMF